jgi:EAL domain-containing protein (putative c-di-GMP-specific phosphodiesterase class I)
MLKAAISQDSVSAIASRDGLDFLSVAECRFAVQPIVPIQGQGAGEWVEMLMRPCGRFDWITPDRLVKALYQRSGVASVDRAIIQIGVRWLAARNAELKLSINVHPETLIDNDFAGWLDLLLHEWDVPPDRLSLEIIEFADTINLNRHVNALTELRSLGVGIALDDYGNGSSNLALLAEGVVNFVKLDRNIVCQICTNPAYATLTRSICQMVSRLGVEMVAEGIETAKDLEALEVLGVHWGQGYYYSRPALIQI